jgi:sulfur-carrier protein adenylyltransferase/sulfurtransferase
MLTNAEKRRYKCHIMLPEVGESGQEKLKNSKVLVIGAGGLGAPVLQYLTAAGVGKIGIMDDDIVNEENLHRQILYGGHDLGKLKTIISKQKLNALNPLVEHEIINIHFKPENALDIISRFDLIVDTTDNDSCNYLINDACILANKPWVYGALQKYEGHISTFNYNGGPSLRCVFPDPGLKNSQHPSQTGLFGVLPGIIGSLEATEVIKIITGIGTPLLGKLLIYNMLNNTLLINQFEKKAENFKIEKLLRSY